MVAARQNRWYSELLNSFVMAPVSRPPMDDSAKGNNDNSDLPSPVLFNEFPRDDESSDAPRNPLVSYEPFFAEYAITAEYNLFAQQNLPGVYCVPTATDPHEWLGVLFLRQGIYQGAILRFTLKLPADFPDTVTPPSVVFEIAIFHPDIYPESGELNVKRGFPNWKCGIHHVYQVLIYMQRCFFSIECSDPVMNEEAAKMYKEDVEKYRDKATDSVRRSREVVYDPPQSSDPNAIKFTPWDQTVHEPLRARILKSLKTNSHASPSDMSTSSSASSVAVTRDDGTNERAGLSFFDDKTYSIMAKDSTWAAPASSCQSLDFSDVVTSDHRKANKPTKGSGKYKIV